MHQGPPRWMQPGFRGETGHLTEALGRGCMLNILQFSGPCWIPAATRVTRPVPFMSPAHPCTALAQSLGTGSGDFRIRRHLTQILREDGLGRRARSACPRLTSRG